MKYLFIIFTILFLISCRNTVKVQKYFKNTTIIFEEYHVLRSDTNIKDGKYMLYYKNGLVGATGCYKNNKRIGVWKYYLNSGILSSETYYNNDKNVAYDLSYNKDGDTMSLKKYVNQKLDSIIILRNYFGSNLEVGTFSHGNGVLNYYDIYGVLLNQTTYRNGLKHGIFIEYYNNYKVKVSGNYKDDNKIGEWIYYSNIGDTLKKEKY